MRVRLLRGLILHDDALVFLPAGTCGMVSGFSKDNTKVEVDFDRAALRTDTYKGFDRYTADVPPELLELE